MSNVLKRVRVILVALILMVVATVIVAFPEQLIQLGNEIEALDDNARLALLVFVAAINLYLGYVIVTEVRGKAYDTENLVVRSREADTKVSLQSVRETLIVTLMKIDDIYSVDTKDVIADNGDLLVMLGIAAKDTIDIPEKTKVLNREIVKVADKQMGLKLAKKPIINFVLMPQAPNFEKPMVIAPKTETKTESTPVEPPKMEPTPSKPVSDILESDPNAEPAVIGSIIESEPKSNEI